MNWNFIMNVSGDTRCNKSPCYFEINVLILGIESHYVLVQWTKLKTDLNLICITVSHLGGNTQMTLGETFVILVNKTRSAVVVKMKDHDWGVSETRTQHKMILPQNDTTLHSYCNALGVYLFRS